MPSASRKVRSRTGIPGDTPFPRAVILILLLILRERLKAGMHLQAALAYWAPTACVIDLRQPVEDYTWVQAYRVPPPRNPEATETAYVPVTMEEQEQAIEQHRQTLLKQLARERRKPPTAEGLMRQRRLGRELVSAAEQLQQYELQRQEGQANAGHEQA